MTDGKYNFSYDSRRLTVSCVTFNEQGVYTVTVSNPAGKNSANIVLSILGMSGCFFYSYCTNKHTILTQWLYHHSYETYGIGI